MDDSNGSGFDGFCNNVDKIGRLENEPSITGNIYSSAKIALGNNAQINGSAYSTKTITGGTITGTREQNMTTNLVSPEIDTSYYTAAIARAATYTPGNRTFSGTNNLSGRIKRHIRQGALLYLIP